MSRLPAAWRAKAETFLRDVDGPSGVLDFLEQQLQHRIRVDASGLGPGWHPMIAHLDHLSYLTPWAAQQAQDRCALATVDQVVACLDLVFETLGCDTPSEEALQIYIRMLTQYPAAAVKRACYQLLEGYVYPSTPKPADFMNHVKPLTEGIINRARLWSTVAHRYYRVAREDWEDVGDE